MTVFVSGGCILSKNAHVCKFACACMCVWVSSLCKWCSHRNFLTLRQSKNHTRADERHRQKHTQTQSTSKQTHTLNPPHTQAQNVRWYQQKTQMKTDTYKGKFTHISIWADGQETHTIARPSHAHIHTPWGYNVCATSGLCAPVTEFHPVGRPFALGTDTFTYHSNHKTNPSTHSHMTHSHNKRQEERERIREMRKKVF